MAFNSHILTLSLKLKKTSSCHHCLKKHLRKERPLISWQRIRRDPPGSKENTGSSYIVNQRE